MSKKRIYQAKDVQRELSHETVMWVHIYICFSCGIVHNVFIKSKGEVKSFTLTAYSVITVQCHVICL